MSRFASWRNATRELLNNPILISAWLKDKGSRFLRWWNLPRALGLIALFLGLVYYIDGPIPYSRFPRMIAFHKDIAPELIGIGVTIILIDWAVERHQSNQLKEKLRRDLLSGVRDFAVRAISELRYQNWLDEILLGVKDSFGGANLEGADLSGANLEGAYLRSANLEGANLSGANLRGAFLVKAHLEGAYLRLAHLERAHLTRAHLEKADLTDVHLEQAYLFRAHLEEAQLARAHLEKTSLNLAHLEGAYLAGAYLQGTYLFGAHLKGADLSGANFEGAHLEGADLSEAHLQFFRFPRDAIVPEDLTFKEFLAHHQHKVDPQAMEEIADAVSKDQEEE